MMTRREFAMLPVWLGLVMIAHSIARDVPTNVRQFYQQVMPGICTGDDLLKGGFHSTESGPPVWTYCQQNVPGQAIFLKGNGMFANMDIDCDGTQISNDTRCASSTDTQGQTTFQSTVQTYGLQDLDARIHTYIVLGNQGKYLPTFDPTQHGIQPLSVVAVVCGDKLVYAVWGDTNGDDGPPLVGEASISTATLCYGQSITGNNGHDENDVLYIAFTGNDAVPGKDGALWNATSAESFEASLASIGDRLIQRLKTTSATPSVSSNNAMSTSNAAISRSSHSFLLISIVTLTLMIRLLKLPR